MPARREGGIGIPVVVTPKVDERSSVEVLKKLSKLKASWTEVSQSSRISLKEIKEISSATANFGKVLSNSAKSSMKELGALGDQLHHALTEAEALSEAMRKAKTPEEKEKISEELKQVSDSVLSLNKQIEDHRKIGQKYGQELKDVVKSQKKFREGLEKSADYSKKDAFKDILKSLGKGLSSGGVGGLKSALSGAGQAAAQGAQGGLARTAIAGGAGTADATMVGKAAGGIAQAAGSLALVAAAVGALWGFLKAASEHQTKLNKALLDGAGFVNDFTSDTKNYKSAVDDLRNASMDAAGSLLRYGANSETAAKAINAFAKESTGSLIKTRETMKSLGKGDVTAGVEEFSRNAIVYGKALGMESTEVAGMMGKFVSETGYGADQVQGLMGNIVKAAATANMPMTKFMGIFRQVLPDVELYQNRLEELTGTIKLLSKTMSAKDVKNFMDAFAKGFQGMDFKQRLKTVLISGTGFVSKTLSKDFDMKAKSMAKNFEKYGINPDEFEKAYKGGEKSMADLMAKAQGNAAKEGAEISGNQIGDAMKLASYEAARKKGGPLNLATAMRGSGVYSTYKILSKFGQTLTTGFDGLSEHVMKQLGISEQQYDALRSTAQSLKTQKSFLQQYGKTNSKSMNKALRETIAMRKGIKAEGVTQKDMQEATDEDLFQASEMSNTMKEGQQTAEDLAQQQSDATMSIADKIDNVIAFLLEKLFKAASGILDTINDVYQAIVNWISGTPAEAKTQQKMIKGIEGLKESFEGKTTSKESFSYVADMMKKQVQAGGGTEQLTNTFKQMVDASSFGGSEQLDKLVELVAKNSSAEDLPANLMKLLTKEGRQVSPRMQKQAMEQAAKMAENRRAGTADKKVYKTVAEKQAAKANEDLEMDLEEINKNTKDSAQAQNTLADASTKPNSPTVLMAKAAGLSGGAVHPAVAKQMGVSDDQIKDLQGSVDDTGKDQLQQESDIYDGIKDVAGILKKGIKYENSWMNSRWKHLMEDIIGNTMDEVMMAYAIVEAKMSDDGFKKALIDHTKDLSKSDASLWDLAKLPQEGDVNESFDKLLKDKTKGSRQMGGPIPDTGLYKLHQGEYVVPAGGTTGGGGGHTSIGPVNVNISGSGLSQQQLEGAVYGAMDKLARRH